MTGTSPAGRSPPPMFVHQHRLRSLLRPEHYTSADHHRLELDRLFRPAWHPVGVAAQLARPGHFLTLDLLGTPVLVRNCGGELRAFLDACPHRHGRLTDRPGGRPLRPRCRDHGREFDADGRTGRIPDAQSSRPWDREHSRLRRFRVGTWGEVVFVSLADGGPPLSEFLAPARGHWGDGFGPPFRYAGAWHRDFPCDWKVVLENALETYHVPELHKKTFREMVPEEDCEHDLRPHYTL